MNFDNQLLQSNVRITNAHQYNQAVALEELGVCEIEEYRYVNCKDRADSDFDQVVDSNCNAETMVTSTSNETIECSGCGRSIYIPDKEVHRIHYTERSKRGVYDYMSGVIRGAIDSGVQKKDRGLKYLDTRFEFTMDLSHEGEQISAQLIFQDPGDDVIDTIRLFDRPVISILVGNAVTAHSVFEDRNLVYISLVQLLNTDENNRRDVITDCIGAIEDIDMRSNTELKAQISKRLYMNSREEVSWREFEHCVQSVLHYLFDASSILGGERTGEQVPDGILSLNWDCSGNTYIWDAKYTQDPPRDLSRDYEDMSKHLVQFRRESNVRDVFGDVSGFILISPRIRGSSVVRLVERIKQRLEETSDQWGGSVIHFNFEALLRLYDLYRDNSEDIQQKPKEFRRHTHRLFRTPSYHRDEPEVYADSDHTVFDVDVDDVEAMVQNKVGPQEVEEDNVNLEGYLANIASLDY